MYGDAFIYEPGVMTCLSGDAFISLSNLCNDIFITLEW